jgi:hypothetical protein
MKKSFIIAACLITSSLLAKSQNLNSYRFSQLDTSKTLRTPLPQFKLDTSYNYILPKNVPYVQLGPLLNQFPSTETFSSKMPVARLESSNDHMPILKLDDTNNVHYTMLIKRIGYEATNEMPKP